MTFAYHTLRVARGAWNHLAEPLQDVYGVWRGEIGWYSDEGAVMSVGTDPLEPLDAITVVETVTLEATVRPTDTVPPRMDGIYAHRWFEVRPDSLDEFLELSEGAWPGFEATFGVRVVGLWRRIDAPDDREHLLLITRYPSLAVWESSRPYSPENVPGAEESRKRFVRRAQLTERTVARVARLVRPA